MTATRLDEWGLRAAEQLESSVGAWVALASFKRLFEAAPPVRERALLGAMRCAASLRDAAELEALAARWASADASLATDEPLQLAREELARGAAPLAATLARAELSRRPRARTAYATARLLEGLGRGSHEEALGLFARAQQLAAGEGDRAVAAACAARRLEDLERDALANPSAPYRARALAIVADVDPAAASGSVKLHLARARLLAPGRFVRAGALSALGELVASTDAALAAAAAFAIARHVDAMGVRLSPLEAERALAGLRALPEGSAREAAIARATAAAAVAASPADRREAALNLAAQADAASAEIASRARHLDEAPASRSFGRDRFADPFLRLAAWGLEALSALAHGHPASASHALEAAHRALGPGDPAPAPLWHAATKGLAAGAEVRAAAITLASSLVQRAAGEPPSGFGPLGEALAAAGAVGPALEALRWAARTKEGDAAHTLARVATSAAWRAHERGDLAAARELLLEARAAVGR